MVICTFFLNNSCRFGSKCSNEHIDIGSIVKHEVDVTLKGNQWPLSCFGPFKERNSIPNFINDQSFEEIRMMYLEANRQNNIPAHQMQLAQMINDAKTKLQWLTAMNHDILNMLVEVYNKHDSGTTPAIGTPSNPFASIGNSSSAKASSIFGGTTGGNAFGSGFSNNTEVGVPSSAAAIFGQTAQSSGNIFGTSSSATSNIFAKPGQTQQQSNIFGMAQAPQPTNSIFGGPGVLTGGMFGSVQQPPQTTTSLFGSVATPVNSSAGNNIFAKPIQQPNAFGQQPNSGAFGGGNIFGSNGIAATPATGFGTVAAQPQQNAGVFSSVSFGTNQSTTPFAQFGTAMPAATPSQSPFLPAPTATTSPFGASVGTNAFGAPAMHPGQAMHQSATMYSKMEELAPQHLAAFSADKFQLGRIPTAAPPKELCH